MSAAQPPAVAQRLPRATISVVSAGMTINPAPDLDAFYAALWIGALLAAAAKPK